MIVGVVDTNVPIVANGRSHRAKSRVPTVACRIATVKFLIHARRLPSPAEQSSAPLSRKRERGDLACEAVGGEGAAAYGVLDRYSIGNVITNTAPLPSVRLRAMMVPPWASMKPRQMASPKPVPAR